MNSVHLVEAYEKARVTSGYVRIKQNICRRSSTSKHCVCFSADNRLGRVTEVNAGSNHMPILRIEIRTHVNVSRHSFYPPAPLHASKVGYLMTAS